MERHDVDEHMNGLYKGCLRGTTRRIGGESGRLTLLDVHEAEERVEHRSVEDVDTHDEDEVRVR